VLLGAGASADSRGDCGFSTPLHRAALTARTAVMRALLDAGAVVDARDDVSGASLITSPCLLKLVTHSAPRQGEHTPLHYAALRGHADIVRLLLEAGANPSLLDCVSKEKGAGSSSV
jgi:ankyrin repeat protein